MKRCPHIFVTYYFRDFSFRFVFSTLWGSSTISICFSFLNLKIPWSNSKNGFTRLTYLGGPISGAAAKAPWSFLYGNQIVLCQQKYESKTQMLHISAQCGHTPTDHILFFLFYWKLLKRIPTIFLHVRKLLSVLAIQKWWIGRKLSFFVTFWRFSIFGILMRKIFIKKSHIFQHFNRG